MALRRVAFVLLISDAASFSFKIQDNAPQAVKVQFFGEAGCPDCRGFVSGPLSQTLKADGVADQMEFEYFPFGNAYYVTEACGGKQYSVEARKCFNQKCGRDAKNRPSDCFTGELVCQHGEAECLGNRYIACAKQTTKDFQKHMPFVECFEKGYENNKTKKELEDVAKTCTSTVKDMPFAKLSECFNGKEGDKAIAAEAAATPEHQWVPHVLLNGQALTETDTLLRSVCKEVKGDKPAGCACLETQETKKEEKKGPWWWPFSLAEVSDDETHAKMLRRAAVFASSAAIR
eukprot:TRINITY_DN111188_c0_g1_i1.p1 TRINITY_DN111188_c0_g1~~TRINITY_DN111188_c0_g1_i1.p1  ORF type:complete len:308 (+),score=75.55 TRINITY_DN111188_c0_g1_i1:59-925(+)